eukprot:11464505-Alexandrium_andersonii.AAC.1
MPAIDSTSVPPSPHFQPLTLLSLSLCCFVLRATWLASGAVCLSEVLLEHNPTLGQARRLLGANPTNSRAP